MTSKNSVREAQEREAEKLALEDERDALQGRLIEINARLLELI